MPHRCGISDWNYNSNKPTSLVQSSSPSSPNKMEDNSFFSSYRWNNSLRRMIAGMVRCRCAVAHSLWVVAVVASGIRWFFRKLQGINQGHAQGSQNILEQGYRRSSHGGQIGRRSTQDRYHQGGPIQVQQTTVIVNGGNALNLVQPQHGQLFRRRCPHRFQQGQGFFIVQCLRCVLGIPGVGPTAVHASQWNAFHRGQGNSSHMTRRLITECHYLL